ncbi:calcium-binding protein 1-like [Physella acuta]|uniref:calcium-binding protein 1-like n=1 Tax=Physella acuta TaxID=109671 RepID=UPI0027DB6969|nr:calcium-binding protein 1-like [Physella acuta]
MLTYLTIVLCLAVCTMQQNLYPYDQTALAMFKEMDIGGNGVFERYELDIVFREYDSNNDGRVTRHEYTLYIDTHNPELHKISHQLYDIYDVDGDHHLDMHDYDNFYTLMEGDGDGVVSQDEFVRYWTVLLQNLDN